MEGRGPQAKFLVTHTLATLLQALTHTHRLSQILHKCVFYPGFLLGRCFLVLPRALPWEEVKVMATCSQVCSEVNRDDLSNTVWE